MDIASVTLAEGTIHNPDEPRHFMKLKPVPGRIVVRHGDDVLAVSTDAVRLLEVGGDLYDPVLYVPMSHVSDELKRNGKTSRCPLKGEAVYYDFPEAGAAGESVAWCYLNPRPFAQAIAGHVAFRGSRVVVEEHPVPVNA